MKCSTCKFYEVENDYCNKFNELHPKYCDAYELNDFDKEHTKFVPVISDYGFKNPESSSTSKSSHYDYLYEKGTWNDSDSFNWYDESQNNLIARLYIGEDFWKEIILEKVKDKIEIPWLPPLPPPSDKEVDAFITYKTFVFILTGLVDYNKYKYVLEEVK